ncbi:MAG: hypothetical protein H7A25_12790 [Leptospiraceae bacterium]|nr:hypothetical protein [Leptospiraceae bacterium]MCP5500776.1 hypothetical protein [Leptospiraceae bacterium]
MAADPKEELQGKVKQILSVAKEDMFSEEDKETVKNITEKIASLKLKAGLSETEEDREFYKERLEGLVEHLSTLALSRLNVVTTEAKEQVAKAGKELLLNALENRKLT